MTPLLCAHCWAVSAPPGRRFCDRCRRRLGCHKWVESGPIGPLESLLRPCVLEPGHAGKCSVKAVEG